MEIISRYFQELTETQNKQFAQLDGLYREWNEKINVISRKDIDNLYTHHILHSLALAQVANLSGQKGRIIDVGTGGGFPGIPLAIMYPEIQFELVDSIRKKTTVAAEVAQALGLKNVKTSWGRAEEMKTRYDVVVTRAVTSLTELYTWCKHLTINGIWAWKGIDSIAAETEELNKILTRPAKIQIYPLSDYFVEEFFSTKALVWLPV